MNSYGSGFITIIIYAQGIGTIAPPEDDFLLMDNTKFLLMDNTHFLLMAP